MFPIPINIGNKDTISQCMFPMFPIPINIGNKDTISQCMFPIPINIGNKDTIRRNKEKSIWKTKDRIQADRVFQPWVLGILIF